MKGTQIQFLFSGFILHSYCTIIVFDPIPAQGTDRNKYLTRAQEYTHFEL